MKYSVSVLSLLLCCASQRTHARVGSGIEEKEAGQRITLPASETRELIHGICVTGAISAHAKSSNLEGLQYTAVNPFRDGTLAFGNRDYKVEGITFSPCAGGIFLRPSLTREIDEGTVIEVTAIPDGSPDTKVCVYVKDMTQDGILRDGNWPTNLVNMGFIPYDSQGFMMYVTPTFELQADVFCKVLTKQKRCDDLFVLDNFDLETTTPPLQNPSLGDTIIASYQNAGPYPINSGVYTITNVNYDSICTVVKAYGAGAPKCDIEMEITFCKVESCASTTMSGKFMASGTGPKPYAIVGGTGDLFAAGGTIDAELNLSDLALKNMKINLCFNNRE